MRKIFFAWFLAGFFLSFTERVRAQDFHLSQYDAPPLFLNPSMTGMFEGYYRIHAHYRTQWASIGIKPFQTTVLSFDMPYKKISLGGQILNYRAGAGNYNAFSLLFSGAYDYAFDAKQYHHLASGLQLGFIRKTVDLSKLYFENQYYPQNGGGFNTSLPSGEQGFDNGIFQPDINAGVIYYYAGEMRRLNPFIGVSAFHIIPPRETFYDYDNRLPLRYIIHGGCKVSVSEVLQFLPKFMLMRQTNDKEFSTSLLVHYYLKGSDAYIFAGPTYRNKDAAIMEAGLKQGMFTYRISYDVNTSSLKPTTSGRGGFEISVTYIARKQKPNPIPSCPRL